ncbi:MAG: universal stress protein [Alphaproteobacteria bacterium]
MSIKTILVHLADDPDHMARLGCAIDLAEKFQAHLTGLYISSPLHMPREVLGRGASLGYLATAAESRREHAERVEKEFREQCGRAGVPLEWRYDAGDHTDVLAAHSIYADLTIVSRLDRDKAEYRLALPFPDELPLLAACPVLMLPPGYNGAPFGRRIIVGWKLTREAGRTARAAVPFMTGAESVIVLVACRFDETRELPGAEIANTLDRYGVKVEINHENDERDEAGEVLLAKAAELDCDMLVMGAFGHSRLKELIFGGTTKHVMGHATIPVLMAH